MKTKIIIGLLVAAYTFCVNAVPAHAAGGAKKTAKKIINFASDSLWRNKGTVAGGVALATAAANPEPFVNGFVTILAGTGQAIIQTGINYPFYCLLGILCIVAVRWFLRLRRNIFLRVLPLLLVGLFLCTGVAEAGIAVPDFSGATIGSPWWNVIGWLFIIITIFL